MVTVAGKPRRSKQRCLSPFLHS